MKSLLAAIEGQEHLAVASGELAEQRNRALDHYLGRPYGNEVEGRSQVVMRDVADTIEWIKPSLMKVFASGDEVCRFDPIGPEDIKQAEQETEYCNHVLMAKNNGFLILHDWFHDALLQKNGYVLVQHETEKFPSRETYKGLSDEELALLLQRQPAPEVIEHTAYPGPAGMMNDVIIRCTEEYGKCKITNIAPERVRIASDWPHVDLQGCPFVEIVDYVTISELRERGYEIDDEISDTGSDDDDKYAQQQRSVTLDDLGADREGLEADPATRRVRVRYVWINYDEDEDGIAELLKVTVVGTTILEKEETDLIPVAAITPMRIPHEHNGQSIDDIVDDLQEIRTTLTRGFLDNMYLANNGRYGIDANVVNLDDMLVARPGGVVRVNGPVGQAITPLIHPQNGRDIIQAIEYVDTVRENRTGVTKYNQGLDSQSLNKTAHGLNQIMSASQQRIELIARIFAETGVKCLMLLIHAVSVANGRKGEMLKLRNEWIPVDPREWRTRRNVTVSVGLGTGNKDQMLQHLMMILQAQKEGLMIGVTDPQKIYNALAKLTQNAGFKEPDEFWTDPARAEPKPPQPSPEQIKAQADQQTMQAKLQAEQQKMQAEQQADAQKFQAQTMLDKERMAFEAAEKEKDRQLQAALAQMQEATKIEIARMRDDASIRTAAQRELPFDENESKLGEHVQRLGEVGEILTGLQKTMELFSKASSGPKMVLRDDNGKIIGVQHGDSEPRPVIRGPDGKIVGIQ
jgi:hypothetical protein